MNAFFDNIIDRLGTKCGKQFDLFIPKLRLSLFGGLFFLTGQTVAGFDTTTYASTVRSWCNAINSWDLDQLRNLYGDTVLYYGTELPAERCVKDKLTYMSPFDAFRLEITGPLSVAQQSEHIFRCDFQKTFTYKGKTRSYPSYLFLFDDGYNIEIIGESDLITDKNLAFQLEKSSFLERTEILKASVWPKPKVLFLIVLVLVLLTFFYLLRKRKSLNHLPPVTPGGTSIQPMTEDVAPSVQMQYSAAKVTEGVSVPPPEAVDLKTQNSTREGNLENVFKGRDFENFVVKKFLPKYFTQLERTSDKGTDGIYPLSNSNPDLVYEFQLREFKKQFAVECKYRQNPKDPVPLAKPEQITRYKAFAFDRNMPVYIALGLGGDPLHPKELFLIPLDDCKSAMTYEELANYRRSTKEIWYYKIEQDRLT